MVSEATPAPRPTATPRATPRSISRVGSAVPSRAGSTLRRLPPRKQSQKQQPARVEPPRSRCPNPDCPNPDCQKPDVQEIDGLQTCVNCGATVPDSNIVSEVTFGESSSGAAVVQGGFVGEGQRHARTLGPAFKRGAQTNSQEQSEGTGREEIRKIANFLNISRDGIIDVAVQVYKLAVGVRFIVGRRVRTVAAVCLYVACRRTGGESTVLLIDFAEAIKVNVFRLGEIYQTMRKTLLLNPEPEDQPPPDDRSIGRVPLIEVEELIQRYAQKLEFGDKTQRVANDAAKIIKRMKRDWITTGRNPSGLCGACIILAARMNNFRRTVREVVYVVKVADITVGKRLEEFKRTESSALSVEQFREHGLRLKKQHDPPVLYDTKLREMKKRKLHEMYHGPRGNPDQVDNQADGPETSPNKLRRDAEGFAIPAKPVVPVDPSLDTIAESQGIRLGRLLQDGAWTPSRSPSPGPYKNAAKANKARKRQRPKKQKLKAMERPEMKVLTPADLTDEQQLELEIQKELSDEEVKELLDDVKFNYHADRANKAADEVRTVERERRRQEVEKRRQETGLVIEVSDGDDSSSDHAEDAEQIDNGHSHENQRSTSSRVLTRSSRNRQTASPAKSSPPKEPSAAVEGGLTPAPSQAETEATTQPERCESPDETMMSGALMTPPPTQAENQSSSRPPSLSARESPELIRPAPKGQQGRRSSQSERTKRQLGRWDISSDPDISPSEFDDDPEVKFCRLSEDDIRTKEIIWVTDNEEWLRDQQRKHLRRAMNEARGPKRRREGSAATDGQAQEPGGSQGVGKKPRKKRGKMGDGQIVEEGGKPQSAAEAAHRMINKRGKGFSRWVNKTALDDHLKQLYTARRSSSNDPTSSSGTGSAVMGSRPGSEAPDETDAQNAREASAASSQASPEPPAREGTQEKDISEAPESPTSREPAERQEFAQPARAPSAEVEDAASDADAEEEDENEEEEDEGILGADGELDMLAGQDAGHYDDDGEDVGFEGYEEDFEE